jgi:hypothetical protein
VTHGSATCARSWWPPARSLLHIGDTKVVIDPCGLERRLGSARFEQIEVSMERDSFRFRALEPAA